MLPRRTKFSRTAAGDVTKEQVVAANIDEGFIVAALGDELNLRRAERYLTWPGESGANPASFSSGTVRPDSAKPSRTLRSWRQRAV